jgi:hypothetical protein
LDLFLRRGATWDYIREMRERWEIDAQPQMPPPYPHVFVPETLGQPPEEQFGDEADEWHAKYREWTSDLMALFEAVVPEEARDSKYFVGSFWGLFLPMCVLYDPPETQLEDFVGRVGGLASNVAPSGDKQYWMPAPPIVWLRDADRVETMVAELHREFLEALLEKYVHPQGISSEDAIWSIHEERPDLFERYWRSLRDIELRPYIDVKPHHTDKDIKSAFKILSARHETRPAVGRPTRDELTAVQCAILHDRYNPPDPTDKRRRTWTFERLAEEFRLGTWRAAKSHVQLGRELLNQNFR